MKKPFQSGATLLDDFERAYGDSAKVHLWWLGQSGFLVSHMEDFLAIDPYLSDSLTLKYAATDKPHTRMTERLIDPASLNFVFVILSTHNHTDHLDADTIRPMLRDNPAAQIFAPAANLDLVSERSGRPVSDLFGMDDGTETGIGPFRMHAVPAAHEAIDRDAQGRCKYLGYIVQMGRFSIYHSGDTIVYPGMVERLRPFRVDIAILPINGKVGNMSGREAARLAKDIGAKLVIPCHYDMFEFNTADPADEFIPECQRLGQPYRVLQLGERFSSTEVPA
jgi:L-ascorbate metabolism protein UlaG (beta-lactamase superfamily)